MLTSSDDLISPKKMSASNETSANLIEDQVNQVIYTATFIIGLVGNGLVLLIVVFFRHSRRKVNDFFILNLAIADLLYLFTCLPTSMYMMFATINYEMFCRLIWPIQTTAICVSIFTLTSMAIHRRSVILNPFKPELKHRWVFAWIVAVWFLALVMVIPLMLVIKAELAGRKEGCKEDWKSEEHRRAYTAGLCVAQYILPLTIIAIEYVRIIVDLVHPRNKADRRSAVSQERRKENMQVIKTLATIVILFAVCMLPAQLAWMLLDFGGTKGADIAQTIFRFAPTLVYFHSCLNPIVYGTVTKHFRNDVVKIIKFVICWRFVERLQCTQKLRANSAGENIVPHQTKPRGFRSLFTRKKEKNVDDMKRANRAVTGRPLLGSVSQDDDRGSVCRVSVL